MQTPPTVETPSRFFQLILQEDLLGGWTVIRQTGQTGMRGGMKKLHFPDLERALETVTTLRDQQLKKGFRVMYVDGAQRLPA